MFNSVKTKVTYHTTIAEVKSQLNMEQDYVADDTYLTQLVKRATSLAENYLDADIAKTTIVYEHFDFAGIEVLIHDTPFISLQSVVYLDSDGAEQTVTLADIEIKKSIQKTSLILPDSLDTDLLTASYTTGYLLATDVPIEIQDAILLKSSDLYDVQRGSFISKAFVDSGAFQKGLDFHKKISY